MQHTFLSVQQSLFLLFNLPLLLLLVRGSVLVDGQCLFFNGNNLETTLLHIGVLVLGLVLRDASVTTLASTTELDPHEGDQTADKHTDQADEDTHGDTGHDWDQNNDESTENTVKEVAVVSMVVATVGSVRSVVRARGTTMVTVRAALVLRLLHIRLASFELIALGLVGHVEVRLDVTWKSVRGAALAALATTAPAKLVWHTLLEAIDLGLNHTNPLA